MNYRLPQIRTLRMGLVVWFAMCCAATVLPAADATDPLGFAGPENGEYRFDTGVLQGVLRRGGQSMGLAPVLDGATGKVLTKSMGCLSPYRILSTGTQHGTAAWKWASEAKRLPDGAVEVRWAADETYPLDMTAVYRWATPNTADLTVSVTARKDLPRFEVFVASYLEGFTQAAVYARDGESGEAAFVPALKSDGVWQVFLRDDKVAELIGDGRWQHPPHPVKWGIRDMLAAPLGMRRNPELGLTVLVMAPPEDCFAVYTPYSEDSHGSLYLGLLGRDVPAGQTATSRARFVVGRNLTDEQAVEAYRDYVRTIVR